MNLLKVNHQPLPQKSQTKLKTLILIISCLSIIALLALITSHWLNYSLVKPQLLSPLAESLFKFTAPRKSTSNKIVFGFLPFWTLNHINEKQLDKLTHLAYFAISFNDQGEITKRLQDNTLEPGWHNLNQPRLANLLKLAKSQGVKTILVIKALDPKAIEAIVANQKLRNKVIQHTLNLVTQKGFDGVNLDFEYPGTPDNSIQQDFSLFVRQLSDTLKRELPPIHLSVDVFADSASKNRLWQLSQISRFVDHLIIMAYDFHRPSSPTAGPVAPIRGGCKQILTQPNSRCPFSYDVSLALSDSIQQVPASQIILALPFYGYQWHTIDKNPLGHTYPQEASLATLKRINQILKGETNTPIKDLETGWHEQALSPYLTFKDQGENQVIWYENLPSLKLKFNLVHQADLAGAAFWALGYEGDSVHIWQLVDRQFFSPPTNP